MPVKSIAAYTHLLKEVRIIAREVDNLPTNFGVAKTFRPRLIGQQLSDASRDLATLSFDLLTSKWVHGIGFLPTKFRLRRPFRSRVMLRTDRQTPPPIL